MNSHVHASKAFLEDSPSNYRIHLVAKVFDFWLVPNFHINSLIGQFITARGAQSFQPYDGDRAVHNSREITLKLIGKS